MSPSSSTPWKPATTAICPCRRASKILVPLDGLDARLGVGAVGQDLDLVAEEAARVAALSLDGHGGERRRRPARRWRRVRPSRARRGPATTSWASLRSRLVSPLIALTMTHDVVPRFCVASARAATFRMRSIDPTDVPPNFWTMRATVWREA